MVKDKVAAAVVGCGAISRTHLTAMAESGIEVLALCDLNADAASARKSEFGLERTAVFSEYAKMLDVPGIDIVAVATPPFLHLEQIVGALERRKYVYSEKPVATRLCDYRRIFEAESASGRSAYFSTSRFRARDGAIIRSYIRDGAIGDIYRVDVRHFRTRGRPGIEYQPGSRWFLDRRTAIAGMSADMGMYFMDKVFSLTNWPEITSASGQIYKRFPHDLPADTVYDVEEHVVCFLRTQSDLVFTFELANVSHHEQESTTTILGTGGGVRTHDSVSSVELWTERGGGRTVVERPVYRDEESGDIKAYRGLASLVRRNADADSHESPAVRDSATDIGRDDFATNSAQCFRMHQILQMVFQSARERREVSPDEIDETAEIFPGFL